MDDYISRKYAVEWFMSFIMMDEDKIPADVVVGDLKTAIPAADVEPVRHGRWERCFEDWRQQIEGDKCSACGFEYYGTGIRRFHYCPSCGAKMDVAGLSEVIERE